MPPHQEIAHVQGKWRLYQDLLLINQTPHRDVLVVERPGRQWSSFYAGGPMARAVFRLMRATSALSHTRSCARSGTNSAGKVLIVWVIVSGVSVFMRVCVWVCCVCVCVGVWDHVRVCLCICLCVF
jgi:hypothetical protein